MGRKKLRLEVLKLVMCVFQLQIFGKMVACENLGGKPQDCGYDNFWQSS